VDRDQTKPSRTAMATDQALAALASCHWDRSLALFGVGTNPPGSTQLKIPLRHAHGLGAGAAAYLEESVRELLAKNVCSSRPGRRPTPKRIIIR
jgi:hypothetical protein